MMGDEVEQVLLYRGVNVENLTKEELIEALRVLYHQIMEERRNHRQSLDLFVKGTSWGDSELSPGDSKGR